jgi:LmbE family N-acetylglucosaminyl deacetylase
MGTFPVLEAHFDRERPLTILCLGAHSDDLEIGAIGTVMTLLSRHPGSSVTWVVFSGDERRHDEARASAAEALTGSAQQQVQTLDFRENYFPYQGMALKNSFEALKRLEPDLIFSHARHDRHQDHRTLAELAWNAFRDHLILEYEIPKYEGDLQPPNLYVPLEQEVLDRKLGLLRRHFVSQQEKPWYDDATFLGLMRLRGVECRASEGYAEAFHASKMILG